MEKVKVYNKFNAELPKEATPFSAAKDIRANVSLVNSKFISNGNIAHVTKNSETGFASNALFCAEDDPENVQAIVLNPSGRVLIPSGLKIELPAGHSMDVRPRSGLALKYGMTVLNTPGLIDEDYRGDVGVIIVNTGIDPVIIVDGERIAQIKINKDIPFEWETVEFETQLSVTSRSEGGFNSSGTK